MQALQQSSQAHVSNLTNELRATTETADDCSRRAETDKQSLAMHVHQLESELDIQRKHSGQTLDEVVSEAQAAKEAHGSQIQSFVLT